MIIQKLTEEQIERVQKGIVNYGKFQPGDMVRYRSEGPRPTASTQPKIDIYESVFVRYLDEDAVEDCMIAASDGMGGIHVYPFISVLLERVEE